MHCLPYSLDVFHLLHPSFPTMVQFTALPRDCATTYLAYLTGLEFLRYNILNKTLHQLSSTTYLNNQWTGYLQLSDAIRKSNFPTATLQHYPKTINRKEAINLLRLRCTQCRIRTKYINEFTQQRVCEACEKEKKNTAFKLVTEAMAMSKLTAKQLASLPAIERSTGRKTIPLYLATDVDRVCKDNKEVGDTDSSDENEYQDEDVDKQLSKSGLVPRRVKSKGRWAKECKRNQAPNRRPSNRRRNKWSRKATPTTHASSVMHEEMYSLSLSGISCLVLKD
jgi:hypothetical protein